MISWPSTVKPVIVDPATSEDAFAVPAAALALRSIDSAVISPPKSETASAVVRAWALDETPGCAATCPPAEPIRTIEPSSG